VRRLAVGLGASLVWASLAAGIWGRQGAFAALTFGLVATGLQLLAARLIRRTGHEASVDRLAVYGIGMLLRITGVVILGVAVTQDRNLFPPLPAALGYLGTVLPLLYLETRPTS